MHPSLKLLFVIMPMNSIIINKRRNNKIGRRGVGGIGGVIAIALVAIAAVFFVINQVDFSKQAGFPEITIKEKIDATRPVAEILSKEPLTFAEDSRVEKFGCEPDPNMPACRALIDVENWDQFAQVVREEIFSKIKDRGFDPCTIILSIAVTDNSLWKSYTSSKDPRIADCK